MNNFLSLVRKTSIIFKMVSIRKYQTLRNLHVILTQLDDDNILYYIYIYFEINDLKSTFHKVINLYARYRYFDRTL